MKLQKGDEILVTIGKDRGKRGKIQSIFPKKKTVLIPTLNIFKRHLKKRDEKNPGGILDLPRPIPVENVSLICPKCHLPTRIGYTMINKEKQRICQKCKKVL